ncbi:hypothetical protein LAZ67_12001004 [Cordylochernes scorpioides]|uniref:Integrase catalytic domain-containing protein n=1 Tax=Cordylochernes scorpioides TaxID=51811 RepID=A0ABY6L3N9_9ARAC|nr:hypothetical protein LAZ67_12001004 [Cordylochernes scorpioides]
MPGHRKRRQFKQTDAFTRGMVIGLKRAGWSIRQIAADTHLGASTVHRLWRRWLEQGNVAIYRNVGATRVTSARVDRRILRQAVAAPQATCTAILQHVQDTLDHSISTRTISRRLVANGLHSCRPLRRLPLTPPNRRQRLEWCRARSTWMTEWHRVVFSDESRFCLSSDSRRVRVWRRRGERSNPAAIVERPTVRQRGIMVWGAIAYDSRSPLLRIQGTMTAQRYVDDVLRPVTLPYLQGVPNALYYMPRITPDRTLLALANKLCKMYRCFPGHRTLLISHQSSTSETSLDAVCMPCHSRDAIRTLIGSLPRRVAACIAVRGVVDGTYRKPIKQETNEEKEAYVKWEGEDAISQLLFTTSVMPDVSQLIIPCSSAKDMWDKLLSVYEQSSGQRLDMLYNQFFNFKKDPTDDISKHISKLESLWNDMQNELTKQENFKLLESMLICRIINTLHDEYFDFKSVWESVSKEERSVDNLTQRLRLLEIRIQQRDECSTSSSTALMANAYENKQNMKGKVTKSNEKYQKTRETRECYFCHRKRHLAKDCRYAKQKKLKDKEKDETKLKLNSKLSESLISERFNEQDEDIWIGDSGATNHITRNASFYTSYKDFPTQQTVKVGSNEKLIAYGSGTITIETCVKGKWQTHYLTDVWYVPNFSRNVMSLQSTLDKGFEMKMDKKCCKLFKTTTGEVIVEGKRLPGGLYGMLITSIKPENAAEVNLAKTQNVNMLQLWHERFGHQNKRHVQKWLKEQGIDAVMDNEPCEACIYGKQHRLSFGSREQYASTQPGNLIHVDVCGPIQEVSKGGMRYFVCFKDDFTKYRITMPYTPQQNGSAERENRTLIEAARSMIYAKNMSLKLWAEAVNTATYVLNRTGPTQIEGKTPYELWFDKKPAVDHFRIFGTECLVHVPDEKRRKLDAKSEKGILVGYCSNKDGYRIWMPNSNKVVTSRDVIFKETIPTFSLDIEKRNKELSSNQIGEQNDTQDIEKIESNVQTSDVYNLRDRSNISKPQRYIDAEINIAEVLEPKTYKEAMDSPNAQFWKEAMNEEMNSLTENDVFECTTLPPGQKPIDCKWVLKTKLNSKGEITRYKARLVAKGFVQKKGIDYEETFSPVARHDTIRTLLAIAANEDLKLVQFDIKTAFLYGDLQDQIYIKQPEGFNNGTDLVWKLKKSLYGLKQSPRCWNQKIVNFMKERCLKESTADPCLFFRKTNDQLLIIAIYVDDGIIAANKVGKPTDNSTVPGEAEILENVPFREAIGSLMHLSCLTRPDITFALNKVSQKLAAPIIYDWETVKRIFKYLLAFWHVLCPSWGYWASALNSCFKGVQAARRAGAALRSFCQRLLTENARRDYQERSLEEAVVLCGTATPFLRICTRTAQHMLEHPRLAAVPTSQYLQRWAPVVDVPSSGVPFSSLRRCSSGSHVADIAMQLALHAKPQSEHLPPSQPVCIACGSSDLAQRYWSCSARPYTLVRRYNYYNRKDTEKISMAPVIPVRRYNNYNRKDTEKIRLAPVIPVRRYNNYNRKDTEKISMVPVIPVQQYNYYNRKDTEKISMAPVIPVRRYNYYNRKDTEKICMVPVIPVRRYNYYNRKDTERISMTPVIPVRRYSYYNRKDTEKISMAPVIPVRRYNYYNRKDTERISMTPVIPVRRRYNYYNRKDTEKISMVPVIPVRRYNYYNRKDTEKISMVPVIPVRRYNYYNRKDTEMISMVPVIPVRRYSYYNRKDTEFGGTATTIGRIQKFSMAPVIPVRRYNYYNRKDTEKISMVPVIPVRRYNYYNRKDTEKISMAPVIPVRRYNYYNRKDTEKISMAPVIPVRRYNYYNRKDTEKISMAPVIPVRRYNYYNRKDTEKISMAPVISVRRYNYYNRKDTKKISMSPMIPVRRYNYYNRKDTEKISMTPVIPVRRYNYYNRKHTEKISMAPVIPVRRYNYYNRKDTEKISMAPAQG